ncbi:MAG TPA: SDR family NAD(P)-dependent oxidoreductase [Verrucomicrobiae bacterium]|jgi:3-oxoacyl-[acyl-carrier protein] reductase
MSEPKNRVVLITGAAGGLGQELVKTFAGQGWRVAASYHSATTESPSETVWPVALDVTSRDAVEAVLRGVIERWGRIDALINNAGLTIDANMAQLKEVDWDQVLAVNLKGAYLCAQAALRPMIKQREGHIINISSWSGRAGARGQSAYGAAKAGLYGLSAALAREVGSRNVRVNAVLPGILPTKMTRELSGEQIESLAAANALGRINSLEEVARCVAFLTTTQNISGQIFQLDSRIAPWS